MEKDCYALIDEWGKVVFHRESEGEFMTQIYPMLVNELIDKLEIKSDKYSSILIDLKRNRYDMGTIISVSEMLGYNIKDIEYEELDRIRFARVKQAERSYHIRRINTNILKEHRKKKDKLEKEIKALRKNK